jgi:hypothetical protein
VSRLAWVILIAVVAAVCAAAVLLVWRPWDTGPAIQTKALGVWQEQTAADPVKMTVSAAGDDTTRFWVELPSSFTSPAPARLEGDSIVVLGENSQDVVWRIDYGDGADVLFLARPDGSERHVLRRVSR